MNRDRVEDFNVVRSKIDSIVSRWKGLPDPSGLKEHEEVCKDVTLDLEAKTEDKKSAAPEKLRYSFNMHSTTPII